MKINYWAFSRLILLSLGINLLLQSAGIGFGFQVLVSVFIGLTYPENTVILPEDEINGK